ncbi:MAG: hypothetical protein LUD17_10355 [Bacteroidales bacterium]|nr:hypothetical protein [Bacteroidales bacterium]
MNRIVDPMKSPEIQDILRGNDIGLTAAVLSKRLQIEPWRALEMFYRSRTCAQYHDKSTGLYLFSENYLAEEYIRELQSGIPFNPSALQP